MKVQEVQVHSKQNHHEYERDAKFFSRGGGGGASYVKISFARRCFLFGFTFPLIHELCVPRRGLGFHFVSVWVTLGALFLIFEGLGDRPEI